MNVNKKKQTIFKPCLINADCIEYLHAKFPKNLSLGIFTQNLIHVHLLTYNCVHVLIGNKLIIHSVASMKADYQNIICD